MKDDRLEKEFDEYFKGVNISDDITADAKKSVNAKRRTMPKYMKFLSIAASIVLVFAVSLAVILKTDFNKVTDGDPSSGNTADNNEGNVSDNSGNGDSSTMPESPDAAPGTGSKPDDSEGDRPSSFNPPSGAVKYLFYTDDDLVQSDESAYSISSLDSSLKLIENFALAKNASVETCTAGYMDGRLALVKAEVSIVSGLTRDETTVFVEFTDEKLVYDGLADYYDGQIYSYYGAQYYLTSTTGENGEPEFKLHILYNGVKYYFDVHSSDEKAYEKYLNLVTKK